MLVFKLQRALTAQILGASQSALVLLKPPLDVSRNTRVQTAVSAANNVEAVTAVIHAAASGVTTRQRVSEHAKCTSFHTRAILRCVGKGQDNLRNAAKFCSGFVQVQGQHVTH